MKKILAAIICVLFALSLAACGCNSDSNKGAGKTIISQVDENEATSLKPAKAVTHGNISGDSAPDGWAVKSDEGGDFITYIKKTGDYETNPDKCPYIQFGCDDMSADDLFNSVITAKDMKGLTYTTSSVTVGGNLYLGIFVEGDANSLFGTVNGKTMVINYRDVDINDPVVSKIIGGIEIASDK